MFWSVPLAFVLSQNSAFPHFIQESSFPDVCLFVSKPQINLLRYLLDIKLKLLIFCRCNMLYKTNGLVILFGEEKTWTNYVENYLTKLLIGPLGWF